MNDTDECLPPPLVVGVDNGLSGGVVALAQWSGDIIGKIVMPVKQRNGKNEVDIATLRDWLMGLTNGRMTSARYFIEEPVGSKSLNAAKSMAASFHSVRGMFETKGVEWYGVPARTWQKAILGKCAGDTKEKSIAKCHEIWPEEEWLRTAKCKTEHDGMCDAGLVAWWGRGQL